MKLIQVNKKAHIEIQINEINRNFQLLSQEIINIKNKLKADAAMLNNLRIKLDKDIGADSELYSKTKGEI